MKRIRITDIIPASGLAKSASARGALVGAALTVDTDAVQDFAETLAEVIQSYGPFVRSDGARPITHCHVRCGRFLGRVVLF